jgi:hypothetical protein
VKIEEGSAGPASIHHGGQDSEIPAGDPAGTVTTFSITTDYCGETKIYEQLAHKCLDDVCVW